MNISGIRKINADMHLTILSGRLNNAINLIQNVAKNSNSHSVVERLEDIYFAYSTMLTYYIGGVDDPERNKILLSITDKLHDIADDWSMYAQDVDCPNAMIVKARRASTNIFEAIKDYKHYLSLNFDNASSQQIANLREQIFNYIWSIKATNESAAAIGDLLSDTTIPEHDRELYVGALILSLSYRFSMSYIETLITLVESDSMRVASRASTALLLACILYYRRLESNDSFLNRIDALVDDEAMRMRLFTIFIIIERTRIVKDIETKMRDEITPELLRAQQVSDKHDNNNIEVINGNDLHELFSNNPKLENSFKQISQWQSEGADIFLPTFRHLKDFDFFKHLYNWLLPFSKDNSELIEAIKNEPESLRVTLPSIVETSKTMCDSDKYSVLLSFTCVPNDNKEAMIDMYNQELTQGDEMLDNDVDSIKQNNMMYVVANQFVQDLYRLFVVHPRATEFCNIFDVVKQFNTSALFSHLFGQQHFYEVLAESYVKHSLFDDAKMMYDKILANNQSNADIIRKAAYCRLMSNNIDEALELLLRAELADDTNLWTKRKIALCLFKQNKYSNALFYFRQVEKLSPDNMSVKTAIGNCLLNLHQFAEALKYFFEIHYNQPDNINVIRHIAKCSFIEHKLEQAEIYNNKIATDSLTTDDMMLRAHIKLCNGARKDAFEIYKQCFALFDNENAFVEAFNSDNEYLLYYNINHNDIAIIVDAVTKTNETYN